jgi:lysophospholipase L1-like esterase
MYNSYSCNFVSHPNTSFTPTAADLYMGRLDSGSFFAGVLDEVALYNGRLSQTHIGAHYYLSRPYNNLCSPDIRIMPLGDSITRGTGTSPESGYRRPLYLSLTNEYELNIDFVGSYSTGGSTFDAHHQGRSGARAVQKAGDIFNYLVANPADIVLVHLGTNDLRDDTPPADIVGHIETLLDEIDRYDEKITVVLAQIINRLGGDHQPTTDYNTLLEPFVAQRLANGDKLILVNMETEANIIYELAPTGDVFDDSTGLHLVASGYEKMAVVWRSALLSFLSVCTDYEGPPPAPPVITSTPNTTATVNEPYSYQVTATGNPAPTFALTTSPDGMSINETTGLITWTPAITGTFEVTVVAENDAGDHSQSFAIEVRQKPTITSTPVTTATVGELYSYQVTAVGHPAPAYTLTTSPAGMSINAMTGLISWTPASSGSFNVTVQAGNEAGTDEQSFIITVGAVPPTNYRLFLPIVIGN